jgi:hypothetical protein
MFLEKEEILSIHLYKNYLQYVQKKIFNFVYI